MDPSIPREPVKEGQATKDAETPGQCTENPPASMDPKLRIVPTGINGSVLTTLKPGDQFRVEYILNKLPYHNGRLDINVAFELWMAYDCGCKLEPGKKTPASGFCKTCSFRTKGDLLLGESESTKRDYSVSLETPQDSNYANMTETFYIKEEGEYFIVATLTDTIARSDVRAKAEEARAKAEEARAQALTKAKAAAKAKSDAKAQADAKAKVEAIAKGEKPPKDDALANDQNRMAKPQLDDAAYDAYLEALRRIKVPEPELVAVRFRVGEMVKEPKKDGPVRKLVKTIMEPIKRFGAIEIRPM
jgi:hypothetical protein